RDRNLGESDAPRELGHLRLVVRVAVAVHEHDGDRPVAFVERFLEVEQRVLKRTVRAPLRSSSALVATVVPIFTASMTSEGILAPFFRERSSRMPASAASRQRPGFSDSSLCVTRVPSGRRPTMSVNVPPRSIQNCQPLMVRIASYYQRDPAPWNGLMRW